MVFIYTWELERSKALNRNTFLGQLHSSGSYYECFRYFHCKPDVLLISRSARTGSSWVKLMTLISMAFEKRVDNEIGMLCLCGWIRDILEACPALTSKGHRSLASRIAWDGTLGAYLGPAADSRKFVIT